MHTPAYPQQTALPLPADLHIRHIRRERHSEPENLPIDLARLDKAANGAFVVDWDLGLGA